MERRDRKLKHLFVFEQGLKREKQEWEYLSEILHQARQQGMDVFFVKNQTKEKVNVNVIKDGGVVISEDRAIFMLEENKYEKNSLIIASAGQIANVRRLFCPLLCLADDTVDLYGVDMLAEGFEEIDVDFLKKVYDRHYGLPLEIARTCRWMIRESVPEDVEDFYEIYEQPSVRRFLPPLLKNHEEEKQRMEAYIRNQYGFYDYGIWTISDPVSGKIIGRAGFEPGDVPWRLQMGYLIREEYQHRGYGLEVCNAILCYAEEKLYAKEFVLITDRENIPSVKLAEKLGFREDPAKIPMDMQQEHSTKHCFFRKI